MTLGNETYRNFSSFFSSPSVNVIFVRFYPCSLQISHSRWTEVWLLRDKISGTVRSDIMYSHSCLHFVLWKPSLQDVFTAGHFPNGDHFMVSWMCRTPPHVLWIVAEISSRREQERRSPAYTVIMFTGLLAYKISLQSIHKGADKLMGPMW